MNLYFSALLSYTHRLDSERQGPSLTLASPRQAVPTLSFTEAPSDPVTESAHSGLLTLLSRRGPISPLPAGSLGRRRRRPGGGTCEHRAKEETALSPRLRAAAAAGSPRPRQRSRSAPRARPPPRPAGHVVPPPVAAPEAPPGRRLHLRPGTASCLAPRSAAPNRSPATSRSQRPSLPSLARPTAGRRRLICSIAQRCPLVHD